MFFSQINTIVFDLLWWSVMEEETCQTWLPQLCKATEICCVFDSFNLKPLSRMEKVLKQACASIFHYKQPQL